MENYFKFKIPHIVDNVFNDIVFTANRVAKDVFKLDWTENGEQHTRLVTEEEVQKNLDEEAWSIFYEVKKTRGFEALTDDVILPKRGTAKSAGYDIRANEEVFISPNEMKLIGTGLTAYMQDDEFLDLRIRSGLAFRNQFTLQNDAGVIDADYYGNEIKVMIRNEGPIATRIMIGDRIAQGIFVKYLTTDDDFAEDERDGGFGSTGVK